MANLIETSPKDKLRILNATVSQQANFDEVKQHALERIPGAVFLDMSIMRDLKAPYPHMMPSNEHFVRMVKTLNIRKSMTVVIYDTKNSFFASRAAFMLQSFGHEKVKILDGTFAKWKKEGRPIESDVDCDVYDQEFDYKLDTSRFSTYEQVKEASLSGTCKVIDSRPETMV